MAGELVELFKQIQATAEPKEFEIEGRRYHTGNLRPVSEPMPEPLKVSNLSSLVTYLSLLAEDDADGASLFVHVESPRSATVESLLVGDFAQRPTLLVSTETFFWDGGNRFMSVEQFVVMLQSQFVQDETTAELLKVIGNIEDSAVTRVEDDGVSQQVVVSSGIARRMTRGLAPRVTLTPYRSFAEVAQAPSPFLLRMQSGKEGQLPQIALFEADGGFWRSEAMKNIKSWLADRLPECTVILA